VTGGHIVRGGVERGGGQGWGTTGVRRWGRGEKAKSGSLPSVQCGGGKEKRLGPSAIGKKRWCRAGKGCATHQLGLASAQKSVRLAAGFRPKGQKKGIEDQFDWGDGIESSTGGGKEKPWIEREGVGREPAASIFFHNGRLEASKEKMLRERKKGDLVEGGGLLGAVAQFLKKNGVWILRGKKR